jgi:hypothetical protein
MSDKQNTDQELLSWNTDQELLSFINEASGRD